MDLALQGLVDMAPETLGRLQNEYLREARSKLAKHRAEQVNIIETCLERPLAQTLSFAAWHKKASSSSTTSPKPTTPNTEMASQPVHCRSSNGQSRS